MNVALAGPLSIIFETALAELRATFVDAIPKMVTAILFLVVAYTGIRVALTLVRSVLDRVCSHELVANLFTTVVGVFLWFAVVLALLKILGMGEIAASLGTATGFVALGVSYALSNMISDTVAGVYLLRDPDFTPGDTVVVDGVTGTVRSIELRKTRLTVEGDVLVIGNSKVESRWTRKADVDESVTEASTDGSPE